MLSIKEKIMCHLFISVLGFGGFCGYITQSLKVMLIASCYMIIFVELMYLIEKIVKKLLTKH